MAPPGQKKPQQGQQNGPKKKGYNPYNKFKNRHWKKKKGNNDNSSKDAGEESTRNHSHAVPSSPVKVIQTPISTLFRSSYQLFIHLLFLHIQQLILILLNKQNDTVAGLSIFPIQVMIFQRNQLNLIDGFT